jgi:hypothetical protein
MPVAQQVFRALITADAGGAIKEYRKYQGEVDKSTTAAAKQLKKSEMAMGRVKMAAAAIGATAVTAIGKYSVDAARDLTESINAVNVMYGRNAEAILEISKTAADGVGLSERAFNESAVAVGGFVNQIAEIGGVGADRVLDELITRAADFGSVFNIDVDEALQRFRSGLAGETEPLRRFGINLLQSEVNAYAMANGIGEVGKTLTEEQKVLARYRLLLEKTAKMEGDFANTSEDLANQQRRLRADLENTAAEFGENLIPVAITAIEVIRDFGAILSGIKVPEAIALLADGIGELRDLVSGAPTTPAMFKLDVDDDTTIGNRLVQLENLVDLTEEALSMGDRASDIWAVMSAEDQGATSADIRFRNLVDTLAQIANTDPSSMVAITSDLERLIEVAATGDPVARDLADRLGLDPSRLETLGLMLRAAARETDALSFSTVGMREAGEEYIKIVDRQHGGVEAFTQSMAAQDRQAQAYAASLLLLRNRFDGAAAAVDRLRKKLEIRSGVLAVSDQINAFEDLRQAWIDAEEEFGAGSREVEEAARAAEQGLIALQQGTLDWADSIEGLPDEVSILIDAAIMEGDFDYVEEWIARIGDGVTLPIKPQIITNKNQFGGSDTRLYVDANGNVVLPGAAGFDTGGVVPGPIGAPQLAVVHGGETILPTHKQPMSVTQPSMVETTVNVNVNGFVNEDSIQQLTDALHEITRRENAAA